jgi:hypothetical protein
MNPAVLRADRDSYAALQAVAGYNPTNTEYSLAALRAAQIALDGAQLIEAQAVAALATARDAANAREWEFHNLVIGARDQVMAQFGRDSVEMQAVGRKRVSEFRSRTRRTPAPEGETPTA